MSELSDKVREDYGLRFRRKSEAAEIADLIDKLLELEMICSGIAYARTAMNNEAVKTGLKKIDSYFAALKQEEKI